MKRREFLAAASACTASAGAINCSDIPESAPPSYLRDYGDEYRLNPREAARSWFQDARFGLFLHYGLYSLLGRGEWVMLRERIPVAEYAKLKDQFTAERFDADFITDLALDAGMKYVNITARHHDSFSLFGTGETDYDSVASPAGRDLVGELSERCDEKGLGFFCYYSYACDWYHPWFYAREAGWANARPAYDTPEPAYLWRTEDDFARYIEFVHDQLRELLTGYGTISGIWFDPIMGYYARPDIFPVEETYALVRKLQPQILISFKQGATGTEDFAAPERSGHSLAENVAKAFPDNPESAEIARRAWESNSTKHNEICDTLLPAVWGYREADDGNHRTPDDVMEMLVAAKDNGCNLLLNTGPLPDGSIDTVDEATLREVGLRLRNG